MKGKIERKIAMSLPHRSVGKVESSACGVRIMLENGVEINISPNSIRDGNDEHCYLHIHFSGIELDGEKGLFATNFHQYVREKDPVEKPLKLSNSFDLVYTPRRDE